MMDFFEQSFFYKNTHYKFYTHPPGFASVSFPLPFIERYSTGKCYPLRTTTERYSWLQHGQKLSWLAETKYQRDTPERSMI